MKQLKHFLLTLCLVTAGAFYTTVVAQSVLTAEFTYSSPGNYSLIIPEDLTVYGEAYGGGGGGGGSNPSITSGSYGGGGGGGGYISFRAVNHRNYLLNVGAGGNGGSLIGVDGTGSRIRVDNTAEWWALGGGGGTGVSSGTGTGGAGGSYQQDLYTFNIFDVVTAAGQSGNSGTGTGGNAGGNDGGAGGAANNGRNGDNGKAPGGGGGGGRSQALGGNHWGGNGGDGLVRMTIYMPYPKIASASTQICPNGNIRLYVEAPLGTGVEYVWYKDGINMVGYGNQYYATESGNYHVTASYAFDFVVGSPATVSPAMDPGNRYALNSNQITLTEIHISVQDMIFNPCSGDNVSVTPVDGTHGNITAGATYSWTVDSNTGVGGVSNSTGFSSAIDLGNLTNLTSAVQTVIYNVTPQNGNCTDDVFRITVNVKPFPQVNPVVTRQVCTGENAIITPMDGSDGTIPNGTVWSWVLATNDGVTGASASGSGINIDLGLLTNSTNLDKTVTYTVTSDYNGCTGNTFTLSVVVKSAIDVLLISDASTCCVGESILLTANVAPAGTYIYEWYLDNTLVSTGGSNTYLSTGLPARLTDYTYHVVVRIASGCGESRSNNVHITVTDPQTVVVTLNHTDICQSGTIRAAANIAQPENYTFKWFLDNVETGYDRLFSTTGLTVGVHTLRVEATPVPNCPSCATSSSTVNFEVHPNPVLTVAADNAVLCAGSTAVLRVNNITLDAAVNNPGNYTLQWALNGTIINGAIQDTYSRILNEPGAWSFTARMIATNEVGCASDWSAPVVVTVENGRQVLLVSDADAYMAGGSVTLRANVTPAGNYVYDWYLDNVLIVANGGNTLVSNNLPVRATSYAYHVVVRSGSGCDSRSNDVAITVFDPQNVSITLNYTDICVSGTIRATAHIAQPENYTFKWFLDNVEIGYERLFAATGLKVGVHTLRVEATPTPNCTGCAKSSSSVNFEVHPDPVLTVAADNAVICAGSTAFLRVNNITLDAAVNNRNNYTLQWALNGSIIDGAIQETYRG